jgi:polysaccharide export outer membrane protein
VVRRLWIGAAAILVAARGFAGDASPDAAPTADQPLTEYRVGIDDVLKVVVWGELALSQEALKVRPDGAITVPLVNDIRVVGLTPMQIRDLLAEKLAQYIRDPNVTVIVQEINSFRVYFLGEVTIQGAQSFSRPPRLLQAIAAAGGLTQFSKKEVVLLRQEGATETRHSINYKLLVAGDPRQENVWLRPGDTLIFP